MRLVILSDMFLKPSLKMTISFTNIARTTANTSKFVYYERFQIIRNWVLIWNFFLNILKTSLILKLSSQTIRKVLKVQILTWLVGNSLHWCYHLCKSRKRRFGQVMMGWYCLCKILNSSSRIYFNWFNRIHFKSILLTLFFESLFFLRQILTTAAFCYLKYFQSFCNGASVNIFCQKR